VREPLVCEVSPLVEDEVDPPSLDPHDARGNTSISMTRPSDLINNDGDFITLSISIFIL
jgi:hypothetical protein